MILATVIKTYKHAATHDSVQALNFMYLNTIIIPTTKNIQLFNNGYMNVLYLSVLLSIKYESNGMIVKMNISKAIAITTALDFLISCLVIYNYLDLGLS